MIQDRYDGPKTDPKNLATQSDITSLQAQINVLSGGGVDQSQIDNLQQQIDSFSATDTFSCFPEDGNGFALENVTGTFTSFEVTHPAMTCIDVCIFDTVLNVWVSAGIVVNSDTSITILFRYPPASNRYKVYIRGKLAS